MKKLLTDEFPEKATDNLYDVENKPELIIVAVALYFIGAGLKRAGAAPGV